eukprot:gene16221-19739_t
MELLEVAQAGVASPGEAVAAVAAADDVNLRGGSGNTPLLWASYFNEKYLVQALLDDDRTDVNATNNKGLCCVHQAAVSDSVDTLKLLLQVLSSQQQLFDSQNSWGESPMHLAAAAGHKRCVQALMDAGANYSTTDKWGRTPVDVGRESGGRRLGDIFDNIVSEATTAAAAAGASAAGAVASAAAQHVLQKEFLAALSAKTLKSTTAGTGADDRGDPPRSNHTIERAIFADKWVPVVESVNGKGLGKVVDAAATPAAAAAGGGAGEEARGAGDEPRQRKVALSKKIEYPGSKDEIQALLLDPTINPAGKDMFGWTALHKQELVTLLLAVLDVSEHNAIGGPKKQTPLEAAKEAGATRAVIALTEWPEGK